MSSSRRRHIRIAALVSIVAALAAIGMPRPLLAQDDDRYSKPKIGTYDLQRVFELSGYSEHLGDEMDRLYEEMRQAQEAGERSKLLDLQQTLEQVRRETIEDFNEAVREALPDIARSMGLVIVAAHYDYLAEGITPQVLDGPLVASMKTLTASATFP